MQSVKDMSVYGTYLGHSGFLLELPEGTLLFDWCQSDLPTLREDRPIYVFISHLHPDHYQQKALDLVLRYPKVEIFLGYDYGDQKVNDALDRLPKVIRESVSCFAGEEKLVSDDGRLAVSTLESTDMGVAFLAEIGGRTYFHAGDLFLLQTLSAAQYEQWAAKVRRKAPGSLIKSYEGYLAAQRAAFEKDTEPLRGRTVDYGMLPLDPRFPEAAYQTVKRYMDIADFRAWSPMHLWDQNEFADAFLAAHPEYADNAAAPVRQAQAMKRIRVGVRFRLFGPDGEPDRSQCSDALSEASEASVWADEVYRTGRACLEGLAVKQDVAKGLELLEQAAGLGSAGAMNLLGKIYYSGKAVERDCARALLWEKKAAQLGDPDAMNWVGFLYENGLGTKKDDAKALEWYRKAADRGEEDAMFHVGCLYFYGRGVGRDHKTALEWMQKAAARHHSGAMNWVGFLYENGYGVQRDPAKALEWYRKAADFGNPGALKNKERLEKATGES